jgi:hypothetical protein
MSLRRVERPSRRAYGANIQLDIPAAFCVKKNFVEAKKTKQSPYKFSVSLSRSPSGFRRCNLRATCCASAKQRLTVSPAEMFIFGSQSVIRNHLLSISTPTEAGQSVDLSVYSSKTETFTASDKLNIDLLTL